MSYLNFQDEIPSLSLCHSIGRTAIELRLDINANPFMQGSDKWHSFNKGWLDAQHETKTMHKNRGMANN